MKGEILKTAAGYPVHISGGNMKTGEIPAFSVTPGATCSAEACRTCFLEGCYAAKIVKLRPSVRAAWDENTNAARRDLSGLEAVLMAYFGRFNAPRAFRVHVSGDFFSREYAKMWARVAAANPGTRFLAFTKQWDNVRGVDWPRNFSLILSGWTGVTIPDDLRAGHYCADCVEKGQTPPDGARKCGGNCAECGFCWNPSKNLYFDKH